MDTPTYYGLYDRAQRIWLGASAHNIFWTTSHIVAEVQRHSIIGGEWVVRAFSGDLDMSAVAQGAVDLKDRQDKASEEWSMKRHEEMMDGIRANVESARARIRTGFTLHDAFLKLAQDAPDKSHSK